MIKINGYLTQVILLYLIAIHNCGEDILKVVRDEYLDEAMDRT
jgi:hypothetical protein